MLSDDQRGSCRKLRLARIMAVETLKKASAPRTLWIRPCTVGTAPGRSS